MFLEQFLKLKSSYSLKIVIWTKKDALYIWKFSKIFVCSFNREQLFSKFAKRRGANGLANRRVSNTKKMTKHFKREEIRKFNRVGN